MGNQDNELFERIFSIKKSFRERGLNIFLPDIYFFDMGFCSGYEVNRRAWLSQVKMVLDSKKNEAGSPVIDEFTYEGNSYRFEFDGERLVLNFNGKKVLDVMTKYNDDLWKFEVVEILGFVDGVWIDQLKEIQTASASNIEKCKEDMRKESEINRLKSLNNVQHLKESFGID